MRGQGKRHYTENQEGKKRSAVPVSIETQRENRRGPVGADQAGGDDLVRRAKILVERKMVLGEDIGKRTDRQLKFQKSDWGDG